MPAKRDYAAEYARRIARAEAKGLSRSQARGHAKPGERPASAITGTQIRGAAKRQAAAKQARGGVAAVRWSTPTPRGTRDIDTASVERVGRAIADVANRQKDIIIGVKATDVQMPAYERKRKAEEAGWVFSGRLPADYVLSIIADNGGDVKAAIVELFREQEVEFGKIERYLVKELGD